MSPFRRNGLRLLLAPQADPLAALAQRLRAAPRRGAVTVVMSNHHVRYMAVPWSELLLNARARDSYVRHLFTETYGEAATACELRLSVEAPGQARLACAIDKELMQGIADTAAAEGFRLRSLQPLFMTAYNAVAHRLPRASGWFAAIEPGRLCLAGYGRDGWRSIRNVRIGADPAHDIAVQLERAALCTDVESRVLHWWTPASCDFRPALSETWSAVRLEASLFDEDPAPAEARVA